MSKENRNYIIHKMEVGQARSYPEVPSLNPGFTVCKVSTDLAYAKKPTRKSYWVMDLNGDGDWVEIFDPMLRMMAECQIKEVLHETEPRGEAVPT